MSPTETSIWDYAVSYGAPSLFMTAVFVVLLPLVYFKFARPRFRRWPSRLAVLFSVWLVAWLIAYGDVLLIAREAKRLCETEAGLRVYRTVEAEGFAGMSGISEWEKKGFSYVEKINPDGTAVQYRQVNGKLLIETSEKPISKYEYADEVSVRSSYISQRRESIREIIDKKILGELVTFKPSVGWLDGLFVRYLGANPSPRMCEGSGLLRPDIKSFSFRNLIDSTIRSIKKS